MAFGAGNPFFGRMAPGLASRAGAARATAPVSGPVPPNPAAAMPPGIQAGLQAFRGWNQGAGAQPGFGGAIGNAAQAVGGAFGGAKASPAAPRPVPSKISAAPQRPTTPPRRAPQPQPATPPGTVPPQRPSRVPRQPLQQQEAFGSFGAGFGG